MSTKVYCDYDIKKSFYNCIKLALNDIEIVGTPTQHVTFINNMVDKFMKHHDDVLSNIKERDNQWHYPLLRDNIRRFFGLCVILNINNITNSHDKIKRMHDYINCSYEELPSLDLNPFDIFLVLSMNPFILSNLLTKDLLKLLVNFGTVASRLYTCIDVIQETRTVQNTLFPQDHINEEEVLNTFVTSLYDECDKIFIYHIKPAVNNVNIDIKSSNEHFKILNKYLNLFSRALDYTMENNLQKVIKGFHSAIRSALHAQVQ